jgi:glyoxylase-like metal-dependent hydrolase (beta-lactamase superfamily II)
MLRMRGRLSAFDGGSVRWTGRLSEVSGHVLPAVSGLHVSICLLMTEGSPFPVKLTFHGGVGEIGGNKILLEDGSNRIFLDFGKNYSKERNFFDFPLLQPRQEKHLLATGILPNLPGIYKQDPATPDIAGILLSHPHGDHWDYIRFVKDTVPIGCGAICEAWPLRRVLCR